MLKLLCSDSMKSEMQLSPLLLSRLDLILFERGEARLFLLSTSSTPRKSV